MKRASDNIPVEEVDSNSKVASHTLKADNAITLEKLLVGTKSHLANEPILMLMKVTILVKELLLNLGKRLEEGLVVSVVQAADEQRQWAKVNGHLSLGLLSAGAECGQIDSSSRLRWLGAVAVVSTWTGAEGAAKSNEYGVYDEVGVGAELVACEGGEGVEEQRSCEVVGANREKMQTLVGLEAVAAVPVTTCIDKGLGTLDVLLNKRLVAVEEAHAYYGENQVDLVTQDSRLFENALVGGNSLVLQ
ncbi:hypothetical protein HG530_002335 [Fusarium avenaceum]|nr:hypothetical protein HG530_002335 [Fusarium avenaceum]